MNAMRRDVFPVYPSTVELRVAEIQPISAGNDMGNVTYALTGPDLEELGRKAQRIVGGRSSASRARSTSTARSS